MLIENILRESGRPSAMGAKPAIVKDVIRTQLWFKKC